LATALILQIQASLNHTPRVNQSLEETRHYVFEYVDALFEGLDAEFYVSGSTSCALNFKRAEENLFYMNNYLSVEEHKTSTEYEQVVATFFNVTLSITPHVPYAVLFCYRLPEKTE